MILLSRKQEKTLENKKLQEWLDLQENKIIPYIEEQFQNTELYGCSLFLGDVCFSSYRKSIIDRLAQKGYISRINWQYEGVFIEIINPKTSKWEKFKFILKGYFTKMEPSMT